MSAEPASLDKNFPLGINGYTYADLHQPLRLRDLHQTFEIMPVNVHILAYFAIKNEIILSHEYNGQRQIIEIAQFKQPNLGNPE